MNSNSSDRISKKNPDFCCLSLHLSLSFCCLSYIFLLKIQEFSERSAREISRQIQKKKNGKKFLENKIILKESQNNNSDGMFELTPG